MLNEAMENYDFKHPEAILLRHNENMAYLVKDNNQRFLLRIHETVDGLDLSAGCRNIPRHILIDSEIELLNLLRTVGNLKTQYPIKNKYNEYITYLEERVPVTLLSWLEGEDLQKTIITDELAYLIGQTIGNIHNAMSKISCPDRYCYDEVFVDKISNDIRKAYELRHITERNYRTMQEALSYIRRVVLEEKQQFIFVHADLSKSNLIYSNGEISPIDFSLSGYALAEMDLSDMNWTLHDEKLTPFLFEGYQSVTKHVINQFFISTFTALYPISYTASHHNKRFQDEKFVQALDRWCDTILAPFIMIFKQTE